MSTSSKFAAGIVALLALCIAGLGGLAGCAGQKEPAKVAAAASRIADLQLPPGYQPEATVELGGYVFVSYAPGDGHSHIMLVQAPPSANIDRAQLEQYAQQAAQSRGYDRNTRTEVVGQMQATLRGKPVTLVIGQGTNSDGQAYRTLTGVFQGKGGSALLSIESPLSRWNQAEVEAFLASIR